MLAEALEVADLEAVLLQHRHHHADLVELAVGEDVALHQLAVDAARVVGPDGGGEAPPERLRATDAPVALWVPGPADGVVEQAPARGEQRVQVADVLLHAAAAHVLEHADGADGVERAVGDVAVVLQPDLDPVGDPGVRDPLGGRARPARPRW